MIESKNATAIVGDIQDTTLPRNKITFQQWQGLKKVEETLVGRLSPIDYLTSLIVWKHSWYTDLASGYVVYVGQLVGGATIYSRL